MMTDDINYSLAWEPSVSLASHSYYCRLPALGLILRFKLFFPIKLGLNLESQNQAKNIPLVLRVLQSKFGPIGQGVSEL